MTGTEIAFNFVKRLKAVVLFLYSNFKGEICMVDMYLALVLAGRRTCNNENHAVTKVPTRYREAVVLELEALGLDSDGNPV